MIKERKEAINQLYNDLMDYNDDMKKQKIGRIYRTNRKEAPIFIESWNYAEDYIYITLKELGYKVKNFQAGFCYTMEKVENDRIIEVSYTEGDLNLTIKSI